MTRPRIVVSLVLLCGLGIGLSCSEPRPPPHDNPHRVIANNLWNEYYADKLAIVQAMQSKTNHVPFLSAVKSNPESIQMVCDLLHPYVELPLSFRYERSFRRACLYWLWLNRDKLNAREHLDTLINLPGVDDYDPLALSLWSDIFCELRKDNAEIVNRVLSQGLKPESEYYSSRVHGCALMLISEPQYVGEVVSVLFTRCDMVHMVSDSEFEILARIAKSYPDYRDGIIAFLAKVGWKELRIEPRFQFARRRSSAINALGKSGTPTDKYLYNLVVTNLLETVKSEELQNRSLEKSMMIRACLTAAGQYPNCAKDLIPVLKSYLTHEGTYFRDPAIISYVRLDPLNGLSTIEMSDRKFVEAYIDTLLPIIKDLGPKAKHMKPVLEEIRKHGHVDFVHYRALDETLQAIDMP